MKLFKGILAYIKDGIKPLPPEEPDWARGVPDSFLRQCFPPVKDVEKAECILCGFDDGMKKYKVTHTDGTHKYFWAGQDFEKLGKKIQELESEPIKQES